MASKGLLLLALCCVLLAAATTPSEAHWYDAFYGPREKEYLSPLSSWHAFWGDLVNTTTGIRLYATLDATLNATAKYSEIVYITMHNDTTKYNMLLNDTNKYNTLLNDTAKYNMLLLLNNTATSKYDMLLNDTTKHTALLNDTAKYNMIFNTLAKYNTLLNGTSENNALLNDTTKYETMFKDTYKYNTLMNATAEYSTKLYNIVLKAKSESSQKLTERNAQPEPPTPAEAPKVAGTSGEKKSKYQTMF